MSLTELPFGFPGRIFRSPIPFGPYDLHSEVYDRFCEEQIAVIGFLAPRHAHAETLDGYGRQWYSTSGADSGGGLMPNVTAWKPWRSYSVRAATFA